MRELPIVFTGESVRALLDRRKTQTRRLIRVPRACQLGDKSHTYYPGGSWWVGPHPRGGFWAVNGIGAGGPPEWMRKASPGPGFPCPYAVGDRLWVKETWAAADRMYQDHDLDVPRVIGYYADHSALDHISDPPTAVPAEDLASWNWEALRKRSSRFMPRWASRLTLEVVRCWPQRLQDISEEEANAEGCPLPAQDCSWSECRRWVSAEWDRLNGKRAPWASNPWVWAVEFRVVEP